MRHLLTNSIVTPAKIIQFKKPDCFFKQLTLFLKIRRKHFDIGIAAGGEFFHRAVKRLLWMKAKKTITIVIKNISIKSITDPIVCANQKENRVHESLRMIQLLKPIVELNNKLSIPQPYFQPPQDWLEDAETFLNQNLLYKKKFIVFGLGARREKNRLQKSRSF